MTASVPPPADDQVREAAVEAVARWLQERSEDGGTPWELWADHHLDGWRTQARKLLALPAVSALVDKARADELDQAADDLSSNVSQSDPLRLSPVDAAFAASANTLRDRATWLRAAIRQTEGNNR